MEIQKLMIEISTWSTQQFPTLIGSRGIIAKLSHLKEEITELQQAVDNNDKKEISDELADCFMLLLDVAHDLKFTENDIIEFSRAKLAINKGRKWGKPDNNGVIHHIREFRL